jgi:hypothetical protein
VGGSVIGLGVTGFLLHDADTRLKLSEQLQKRAEQMLHLAKLCKIAELESLAQHAIAQWEQAHKVATREVTCKSIAVAGHSTVMAGGAVTLGGAPAAGPTLGASLAPGAITALSGGIVVGVGALVDVLWDAFEPESKASAPKPSAEALASACLKSSVALNALADYCGLPMSYVRAELQHNPLTFCAALDLHIADLDAKDNDVAVKDAFGRLVRGDFAKLLTECEALPSGSVTSKELSAVTIVARGAVAYGNKQRIAHIDAPSLAQVVARRASAARDACLSQAQSDDITSLLLLAMALNGTDATDIYQVMRDTLWRSAAPPLADRERALCVHMERAMKRLLPEME